MKRLILTVCLLGIMGVNSFGAIQTISSSITYVAIVGSKGEANNAGYAKIYAGGKYFYISPTDVSYEVYLSLLFTQKPRNSSVYIYYNDQDTRVIDGVTCFAVTYLQM